MVNGVLVTLKMWSWETVNAKLIMYTQWTHPHICNKWMEATSLALLDSKWHKRACLKTGFSGSAILGFKSFGPVAHLGAAWAHPAADQQHSSESWQTCASWQSRGQLCGNDLHVHQVYPIPYNATASFSDVIRVWTAHVAIKTSQDVYKKHFQSMCKLCDAQQQLPNVVRWSG